MRSDTDLLLAYSRHSDASAFAELVNRRVGLVYGCALRLTNGSTLAAEEATQDVFRTLARKAGQAAQSRAVVGWLYTTTRYAAANAVRASRRRRRWESEAHVMHEIERPSASDESWRELRPVLDRALGSLSRLDRDLVLLRFFEGRPFEEIGRAFALSGDAARLRIERALERMRAALRRAGIQSTTAALAAALANEAAAAAPAGLAASVSAGALVPAASAGAGALTLMAISKPMLGIGVALLAVGSFALWREKMITADLGNQLHALRLHEGVPTRRTTQDAALQRQPSVLQAHVAALRADEAALLKQVLAPRFIAQTAWKNRGRSTPGDALETLLWAAGSGDLDAVAEMVAFDDRSKTQAERIYRSMPAILHDQAGLDSPERMVGFGWAVAGQLIGSRVVMAGPATPDDVTLDVQTERADGLVRLQPITLHRTTDGWEWTVSHQNLSQLGDNVTMYLHHVLDR